MEKYVLEAKKIVKQFPGTLALNNITCSFESGKVHAVIGKNGSGKSTLMKIVSGDYIQTSGEIYLYGDRITHNSPKQALENGIATVYQELSLVKDLSVCENMFLGRLPMKSKLRVDWQEAKRKSHDVLWNQLGIKIDVDTIVKELSVGQQQLVEIARAMTFNPKVLILDEPTSALSESECAKLFEVIRGLKAKGIIILFISHRLQELFKIADTVTVFRDGELIDSRSMEGITAEEIIRLMFGEVEKKVKPESYSTDEVIMKIEGVSNHKLKDVSFELKKGEVLGIAGMMGSGRTEVLRAIFGLDKIDKGKIYIENERIKHLSPSKMRSLGVAYTSENRKEEALCLNLSIADNLCLANLQAISPKGKINKKIEEEYIIKQVDALQIKVASTEDPVSSMSGGNQQKVVVGNWLNTDPKILLMDEPSRGIDIKAKQQIFGIMWDAAKIGKGVVMVSSELEELVEVCDRVLIMGNGEVRADFKAAELTVEAIYANSMKESESVE